MAIDPGNKSLLQHQAPFTATQGKSNTPNSEATSVLSTSRFTSWGRRLLVRHSLTDVSITSIIPLLQHPDFTINFLSDFFDPRHCLVTKPYNIFLCWPQVNQRRSSDILMNRIYRLCPHSIVRIPRCTIVIIVFSAIGNNRNIVPSNHK